MVAVPLPDSGSHSLALAGAIAAVLALALLVLYVVGFDQGAVSQTGMYMHELMHDGRHLLGLPCH